MSGRPKKEPIDQPRAIAWFNTFSKLYNGSKNVFSEDNLEISADYINSLLSKSATDSREAQNWKTGKNLPSLASRLNLYKEAKWISIKSDLLKIKQPAVSLSDYDIHNNYNVSAAEIAITTGPDASHLWEVLQQNNISENINRLEFLVNPSLTGCIANNFLIELESINYSKEISLPYLSNIIYRRINEYNQYNFRSHLAQYDPDLCKIDSQPSHNLLLRQSLINDCESRLNWYGLDLRTILSMLNFTFSALPE